MMSGGKLCWTTVAGLYWTASLAHVIQDCVHQLERGGERGRGGGGGGEENEEEDSEGWSTCSSETTTTQLSGYM